jgi:signal transduction histidine kinase
VPGPMTFTGPTRRWLLLLPAAGVGLLVERNADGWEDPRLWAPDLGVGLVVLAAAAWAAQRRRVVAGLLVLTAGSWWLGTLWPPAVFLHVGLLVHLLLTTPGWRPRSASTAAAVVAGYTVAVAMPGWQSETGMALLATGLVAALLLERRAATAATGAQRRLALRTGVGLALILLSGVALRTLVPDGGGAAGALFLHQLAVCGVVVALAIGVRAPPVGQVTDLVVELGEARSGGLRDALAGALRDPGLELGHLVGGRYVDADGRQIRLPAPGGPRTTTLVPRDGAPFAVLVHDAWVLEEPALLQAVASATRLTVSHAALQQEVAAQLAQLSASRRRLVVAADREQQRLERRLREGAERELTALSVVLQDASVVASPGSHLLQAQQELARVLDDLRALAQGLRPRELDHGLCGALRALAQRSPVPLDLTVAEGRFEPEMEAGAWFICVEALANIVKHAGATRAAVRVERTPDDLVLEVTDDGAGGADPSGGTGLAGLADRVDALGGRLRVHSPAGGGTTLTAQLPLRPAPGPAQSTLVHTSPPHSAVENALGRPSSAVTSTSRSSRPSSAQPAPKSTGRTHWSLWSRATRSRPASTQ